MRKSYNRLIRDFGNTSIRYIDDFVRIYDDGEFERNHKEMYPPELLIKKENKYHNSAIFLDLRTNIENKKFVSELCEKQYDFSVKIVRFAHRMSNIPSKMFYSSIASELLRICRVAHKLYDYIKISKIYVIFQ